MPDQPERSGSWEDDGTVARTAAADSTPDSTWVLTSSRWWPLLAQPVAGPVLLGVVFYAIIVAVVLCAPSVDSHFIYTDF